MIVFSVARSLLADTGMAVAREDLALEPAFWAQFPGTSPCVRARHPSHRAISLPWHRSITILLAAHGQSLGGGAYVVVTSAPRRITSPCTRVIRRTRRWQPQRHRAYLHLWTHWLRQNRLHRLSGGHVGIGRAPPRSFSTRIGDWRFSFARWAGSTCPLQRQRHRIQPSAVRRSRSYRVPEVMAPHAGSPGSRRATRRARRARIWNRHCAAPWPWSGRRAGYRGCSNFSIPPTAKGCHARLARWCAVSQGDYAWVFDNAEDSCCPHACGAARDRLRCHGIPGQ